MKIEERPNNEIIVAGKIQAKTDASSALYLYNILKKIKENNEVRIKIVPGNESIISKILDLICFEGFMIKSDISTEEEYALKRVHMDPEGNKVIKIRNSEGQLIYQKTKKRKFIKKGGDLFIELPRLVKYNVFVLERPGYMQL